LELGLANKVVPSDELLSEAKDWATKLSQRSPQALSQTKKIMRMALDSTFEEIFSIEAKIQNQLIGSADNKEAVMAFLEKRPPQFQD
jgi:2-(1,2-epoxy-1,2-dihydrophenyl)acetyl-CoA isomerase